MPTPDEMVEFSRLSTLVAEKKASVEELGRWRSLRAELSGPIKPPPPSPNKIESRQHLRTSRKLRVAYAPAKEMQVTFTEEVGAGGLRLTLKDPADVGAVFAIRLELA